MVDSIQIKNPRIREIVARHQKRGKGRNAAETAENLILDGDELQRMREATALEQPSRETPSVGVNS